MAICRFQQSQFGWADGVVDPGDRTIHRLNQLQPPANDHPYCVCFSVPAAPVIAQVNQAARTPMDVFREDVDAIRFSVGKALLFYNDSTQG